MMFRVLVKVDLIYYLLLFEEPYLFVLVKNFIYVLVVDLTHVCLEDYHYDDMNDIVNFE